MQILLRSLSHSNLGIYAYPGCEKGFKFNIVARVLIYATVIWPFRSESEIYTFIDGETVISG
jgi:hypothetical protein